MAVQIRHAGSQWLAAAKVSFPNEADLQALLHNNAELIPVRAGEDAPRVFVRECGLRGSGSTDLLGVDSDGNIYIVECKLASNQEIRRKVLGQVLEYAAFLWNMPYEDFDQFFLRRTDEPLTTLMRKKAGSDWIEEDFRAEVARNLKSGAFHLVIAVDGMNDELAQVIRYLASCSPSIRLEAIEFKIFKSGDTEVLVPEIHGRDVATGPSSQIKKKTLDQIFDSCTTDHARALIAVLVDEWKNLGHIVEPATKGISFRADFNGEISSVFWWYPHPEYVAIETQWEDVVAEELAIFKAKLAAITGFDSQKVKAQTYPRAYFKDMDEAAVRQLVQVLHEMVLVWRMRNPSES
jgi:hypothetical protein